MRIEVNAPKSENANQKLDKYIQEKFESLGHFCSDILNFRVHLFQENKSSVIEVNIVLPQKHTINLKLSGETYHEIIDLMKDKIKVQLSKYNKKLHEVDKAVPQF